MGLEVPEENVTPDPGTTLTVLPEGNCVAEILKIVAFPVNTKLPILVYGLIVIVYVLPEEGAETTFNILLGDPVNVCAGVVLAVSRFH